MGKQLFINNFETVFAGPVKDSPTSQAPATELDYGVLRLSDGAAAKLINPQGGDYYLLTAFKRSGVSESAVEVLAVTAVDNAVVGECRITVTRAQDGTQAQAYVAGDRVEMRLSAAGARNFAQRYELDAKADKVAGKGLSTEDYTAAEKSKLAGIEAGANAYVHPATHPAAVIVQDANNRFITDAEKSKLAGIAPGAQANVKADWNAANGDAQVLNKPAIGTAAAKDAPATGNAAAAQVVLGNDSRLTDARPASDVAAWAKAGTKPTYTPAEVGATHWVHTKRDFAHGTLVLTDIECVHTTVWCLDIQGNAYWSGNCFDTSAQGYVYNNEAVALGSISRGGGPAIPIRTVRLPTGHLGFWWPRLGYWHGFLVRCYLAVEGSQVINRVVGFADVPLPAVTDPLLEAEIPSVRTVLDTDPRLDDARPANSISVGYDATARVNQVTEDGAVTNITYDGAGRITTVSYPRAGKTRTETYSYNAGGQLAGMNAAEV